MASTSVWTDRVLSDLRVEVAVQVVEHGWRPFPNGTGSPEQRRAASAAKLHAFDRGFHAQLTWADLLAEELTTALAQVNPITLRKELVHLGGLVVLWLAAIDVETHFTNGGNL